MTTSGAEWAYSDFDARHRFVIAEVWELPFGPGKPLADERRDGSTCSAGWTLASIWTWQSGFPYNVFDGGDPACTAGGYTPTCRPNLSAIRLPAKSARQRVGSMPPRTSARRPVSSATRHATRSAARALVNTDVSIIKRHPPRRRQAGDERRASHRGVQPLQPRELRRPPTNISSGAFGRIGSTATEAREFQFGFKFSF